MSKCTRTKILYTCEVVNDGEAESTQMRVFVLALGTENDNKKGVKGMFHRRVMCSMKNSWLLSFVIIQKTNVKSAYSHVLELEGHWKFEKPFEKPIFKSWLEAYGRYPGVGGYHPSLFSIEGLPSKLKHLESVE